MRKFRDRILIPAAAAALAGLVLTGCGQARPEGNTSEKQSETLPAVTEAPIVIQTEAPTEAPQTEAPTEAPQPETQAQSETPQPETAAPAPALSAEEELAQEYEYEDWITMWSGDDINVRETPTTDGENIISSLDKGEAITVIGETVNWFEIYKEYDSVTDTSELVGFVKKDFLYLTEEEALAEHPQETTAVAQTVEATPETTAPEAAAAEPVQETPQTAAPVSTASGPAITVSSDANIRSEAAETASVIGVVNAGTQVTKIGESGNWIQIDYNGTQGYVNARLVG